MKSISESSKKVFVGIDVHQKTYSVCCIVEDVVVKKWRMEARPEKLLKLLRSYFIEHEVYTVYEAGFSGFGLHRCLEEGGFKSQVVHASAVEVSQRDRVKTDKRDALKLSTQLSVGRLHGIRIPTVEEEHQRELTRTRQQLVRHRSAIKNQIRSKFHYFGLLDPREHRELSMRMVRQVMSKVQAAELKLVVGALVEVWLSFNEQLKLLEKEIRKQAETDWREKVYRMLPGFGPLTSRTCSNELGDLRQFSNVKQLYSFTGLTPGEHSSGERIKREGITRQGSSRLRHVLVQAAWVAIGKDQGLRRDYERIARQAGKGGKLKAIVAIARKLIGRARALFRDETAYRTFCFVSVR